MFFQKKPSPLNSRRESVATAKKIDPKHASLMREAWWLVLVVVGIFLAVILFSYHPNDASWSHSASQLDNTHNAGGTLGAWVSDMLLYLFGFSACGG
ncbi:MAG: hypothetical protein HOP04_13980 [Methylophilaceae bacterium]|nr:hypothetical protein [Methylophilaceae bacterium]